MKSSGCVTVDREDGGRQIITEAFVRSALSAVVNGA